VITVVSSDASHPDVRGVKPSNKKLLQKAKKPPDVLRRLFVFRKPPDARTINLTINRSRIMSNIITLASLRISESNPNHHLWNNNGTWFLHYTVYPTAYTKERIRRSLGTKDVRIARERRDNFFSLLAKQDPIALPVAEQTTAFA